MTRKTRLAVPGLTLWVVAAGAGAWVLLSTQSLMGWAYADWVAASALTREALVYAGPWVAGCCAWTAGRFLGTRSMLCPPSAARSGVRVVGSQLLLLWAAALAGYLVGLLPMLVSIKLRAESGSLNWLVLAGSVAVLLAFASLGYLIGCVMPRAVSVVVAVVASFAAVLLVNFWGFAVAPLWLTTPAAGQYEGGATAVFRAVFFTSLALLLAWAASNVVASRTTVLKASSFFGLLLLVPLLMVGAAARASSPAALLKDVNPPSRCQSVHGTPVCVHAAKGALLVPLAETVDRVMASVGYDPAFPVSEIRDASLGPGRGSGVMTLQLQTDTQGQWMDWAAGDLAAHMSGQQTCVQRGDFFGAQVSPALDQAAVTEAFSMWIARSAGFAPPQLNDNASATAIASRLEGLPPSQVQALYHRSAPQLARCELSSKGLP